MVPALYTVYGPSTKRFSLPGFSCSREIFLGLWGVVAMDTGV